EIAAEQLRFLLVGDDGRQGPSQVRGQRCEKEARHRAGGPRHDRAVSSLPHPPEQVRVTGNLPSQILEQTHETDPFLGGAKSLPRLHRDIVRGAMARRRLTVFSTASIVKSISSCVLPRPRPKRIEAWARSSGTPRAFNTCEGRRDADVQADPDETATSRIPSSSASPSTPAKERLRFPGRRSSTAPPRRLPSSSISGSGAPFNVTSSTRLVMPLKSRFLRRRSRRASVSIEATAISDALPNPTIPGTFNVPDRRPRSWPPPSMIGERRT